MMYEKSSLSPLFFNKRSSTGKDLGHYSGAYTKYDFLSLDFNTPQEFNAAIKAAGFNSVDEFRAAYDKNPNILKDKQLGLITDMTFTANRGQGSITGSYADWKMVNLISPGESGKGHLLKITDIDISSINNRLLTSDNKKYQYVDIHCGGPNASEGCVTNTTRTANSLNNANNIFLKNMFVNSVPSLLNPKEDTFILIPSKKDQYK